MNGLPCEISWMEAVTLSTDELIRKYYHPEQLLPLCRACPSYGNNYACPPSKVDMGGYLQSFSYMHLYAAKLCLNAPVAKEEIESVFMKAMVSFNEHLLNCEHMDEGSVAVAPGRCILCPRCARLDQEPCRHPQNRRHSLDAFSLEIARMAEELFGLAIQWYNDEPPQYLTMIGGLLSNSASVPQTE